MIKTVKITTRKPALPYLNNMILSAQPKYCSVTILVSHNAENR